MRGLVNSARMCGKKYSAKQALKLHSKAAGVKQCQSCETHHTPLAKTQPQRDLTPQSNAGPTDKIYTVYTIGILRVIPSMQAETERQYTQKRTTYHTSTALSVVQGCDLRRWMKTCSPSGLKTGWAEMREVTTNTAWVFHSKSNLRALIIQYASWSRSCELTWMHSHSFTLSLNLSCYQTHPADAAAAFSTAIFQTETNVTGETSPFHKVLKTYTK